MNFLLIQYACQTCFKSSIVIARSAVYPFHSADTMRDGSVQHSTNGLLKARDLIWASSVHNVLRDQRLKTRRPNTVDNKYPSQNGTDLLLGLTTLVLFRQTHHRGHIIELEESFASKKKGHPLIKFNRQSSIGAILITRWNDNLPNSVATVALKLLQSSLSERVYPS